MNIEELRTEVKRCLSLFELPNKISVILRKQDKDAIQALFKHMLIGISILKVSEEMFYSLLDSLSDLSSKFEEVQVSRRQIDNKQLKDQIYSLVEIIKTIYVRSYLRFNYKEFDKVKSRYSKEKTLNDTIYKVKTELIQLEFMTKKCKIDSTLFSQFLIEEFEHFSIYDSMLIKNSFMRFFKNSQFIKIESIPAITKRIWLNMNTLQRFRSQSNFLYRIENYLATVYESYKILQKEMLGELEMSLIVSRTNIPEDKNFGLNKEFKVLPNGLLDSPRCSIDRVVLFSKYENTDIRLPNEERLSDAQMIILCKEKSFELIDCSLNNSVFLRIFGGSRENRKLKGKRKLFDGANFKIGDSLFEFVINRDNSFSSLNYPAENFRDSKGKSQSFIEKQNLERHIVSIYEKSHNKLPRTFYDNYPIRFGKSDNCQFVIKNQPDIGDEHAIVYFRDGNWWIEHVFHSGEVLLRLKTRKNEMYKTPSKPFQLNSRDVICFFDYRLYVKYIRQYQPY